MRKEKQYHLNHLQNLIEKHGSFVIMGYERLDASATYELRTEIFKTGGDIEVVPKRLLRKAAEEAGVSLETIELPGHVSLVLAGEDPLATTKALTKFAKGKDQITFLGGHFEGKLCNAKDVVTLSELPSKDEMRAMLLSVFQAPMSQMLAVVNALLTSVPTCLDQKVQKEN